MIKVGNKHIEKWSKMERFLVPKQMGRFLGNSPTGDSRDSQSAGELTNSI